MYCRARSHVKTGEPMQSIIELTNIFTICYRHSARFWFWNRSSLCQVCYDLGAKYFNHIVTYFNMGPVTYKLSCGRHTDIGNLLEH